MSREKYCNAKENRIFSFDGIMKIVSSRSILL
jgi:hypothetical protein